MKDLTKLTRENINAQFCSEFLKSEILALFDRIEKFEEAVRVSEEALQHECACGPIEEVKCDACETIDLIAKIMHEGEVK